MLKLLNKILLHLLLIHFSFTGIVFSAENIYTLDYICRDSKDNLRWQATTTILKNNKDPQDIYTLKESGQGIFGDFKENISWLSILKFQSKEDIIKPVETEKTIFDENGNVLVKEYQKFDYNKKKAYFERKNFSGKNEEYVFTFKKEIINRLIMGLYIQKMLSLGETSRSVYLLSDEPRVYKITIKVVEQQKIILNNKEKKAYKICLDPDIGIFNLIKMILPKAYVWHSAEAGFEWLKYEGVENSPASKHVTISLKESQNPN